MIDNDDPIGDAPPSFTPVPGVAYDCCVFPNPAGSIAVCVLWGVVERIAAQYPLACIVGPCVSPAGVDHLLRTLWANPQIRTVLIDGPDLSGTWALLNAAILVSGALDFVTSLPGSQRVYYHLLPDRPQRIDPVPPPPPGTVGTKRGPPARTFTGSHAFAVWPRLLGEIVRHGTESPTAYGTKQRELLAASWSFGVAETLTGVPEWYAAAFPPPVVVWAEAEGAWKYWTQIAPGVTWGCELNTDGSWHTRRGGFDHQDTTLGDFSTLSAAKAAVEEHVASPAGAVERLDAYASMHFVGDADERPEGVAYTYADRLLTRWDNQIARCVEVLRADAEQRRAVAVTWDVGVRPGGAFGRPSDAAANNPPCLTHLWFRRDTDGSLYTHATFRSHDILRAGIPNAWGLCSLAEHVAGELDWPVGKLTISSLSAHVYSDGYEQAEALAQAHGRSVYEDDDRAMLRVRAGLKPYEHKREHGGCGFDCDRCDRSGDYTHGEDEHCVVCGEPWPCGQPPEIETRFKRQITVDLLLPDGSTAATIESSTATGAEQRVLRAGWVSTLSHAAWLGRELARLETP